MTNPGSARTRCRGSCGNGRLPSRGRGGGSCEGRSHTAFLPIPSEITPGKQAVCAEGKGGRASGLNTRGRRGKVGTPRRGGTHNTPWAARPTTMSSSSGYRGDVSCDPKMMFHRRAGEKEYAPKSGGSVGGFLISK